MANHDPLLDAYSRLHKALEVVHLEADEQLPFDAWVELLVVRHTPAVRELERTLPAHICPRDDCVAEYEAQGGPFPLGQDRKGKTKWFVRWSCRRGHTHLIEQDVEHLEAYEDGEAGTE